MILQALHEFARSSRYFNLDRITRTTKTSTDPLEAFLAIIDRILQKDVNKRTLQRILQENFALAEALQPMTVHYDPGSSEKTNEAQMFETYVRPRLTAEAVRYFVLRVVQMIKHLKLRLKSSCRNAMEIDASLGNRNQRIPFLEEFLQFADSDRKTILRKQCWP